MSKAGTTRLRAAAAITLLSCAVMMILAAFALSHAGPTAPTATRSRELLATWPGVPRRNGP